MERKAPKDTKRSFNLVGGLSIEWMKKAGLSSKFIDKGINESFNIINLKNQNNILQIAQQQIILPAMCT
jgi:hypothetical protein